MLKDLRWQAQLDAKEKVREYTEDFRTRVQEFGKRFHDEAPFSYEVYESSYKLLKEFHLDLVALEEEGVKVNAQQELFEVAVTNWRDLKTCHGELTMLKMIWDHVQLVQDIFNSFRTTLWTAVDCEWMADLTKKLQVHVEKGETLKVDTKVDPRLVGGFTVAMGEDFFDLSLMSRIRAMEAELAKPLNA